MFDYPKTRKDTIVDTYFSEKVADPYRWLEDDLSDETAQWVESQNAVTFDYLHKIPFRNAIREKLETANNYVKESAPFDRGGYIYFYRNDGLQNQSVVYRTQGDLSDAKVFLDPNSWSEEGTTSLDQLRFSRDDKFIAYSTSEGGSDWRTIYVMDSETGELLADKIDNVKFSGIEWRGSEGFYYSTYDKPEGSELSARTEHHKLYFHTLGTSQAEDELVFGGENDPQFRYVGGYTTEDDSFLVITGANATSGNMLYVQDLRGNGERLCLTDDDSADSDVIEHQDGKLIIYTNLDAPMGRIVVTDAQKPDQANWRDLIAETEHELSISTGAGYLFASYLVDVQTQVKQYRLSGEKVRDVVLPDVGTASGFSGREQDKTLYFTFTNYTTAADTYRFDPETGVTERYRQSACTIDSEKLESRQVFYTSKDGTKVPMTICYRKGIELDGSHPTILYGYGGFNISLEPAFNPSIAAWIEMGGIYAVANLRGGGEYGKAWHQAGTQLQKQNVFDDFISAAEFLITESYTSPEKLAIRGGSNGGLLVGACMTQRPDLYKVALPAVGVLDMLRYHTFTSGEGWKYDYGTSSQSEAMFKYLLGYSPVHNVREDVVYPSTLVTTADHDDRVVPAHSYKFIAELQAKHAGENPVLIRIDVNAGHGAGMPMHKVLDLGADVYAFCLDQMGVKPRL
ncbi:prolyl oligopeptidase family serine peptidase [Grimontia kaedaensis]|uniref:prolyl oligopeptidase n=1 Tax=Grimontia kaedaensis TaxID=2872157 RepID=A0ABY4X0D3_9GAMM|nr:prolyl oligopeptidase family serine peptidase [Grimontia kaedaensis]USH04676.1 prolyl oligopeptidase family serine peptidase [Grimontia kaedaensis]